MSSLNQIFEEMRQFRTSKGGKRDLLKYPPLKVHTLVWTGWVGTKQLMFKSEVASSDGETRRLVSILFNGVNYSEKQDAFHPFRIKIDDYFFFAELPTRNHNCAIRCSCPDSYYRWGHNLYNHKSWIGPRPSFPVKGTGYPQNPLNKMGICKHTWALIQMLEEGGVLR